MKKISPIVLFVYNRPLHTERTLDALRNNTLAQESDLVIYADGAKVDASEEEILKISKVRSIIRSKQWCKSVTLIESDHNKGLAASIIEGVSNALKYNECVIVLEDDIVTSPGFLQFMNDALTLYEHNEKVMHVSGFMYPHKIDLPQTFFFNVPLCWGWGTWRRAWSFFIEDTDILIKYIDDNNGWKTLNKFGGDYLGSQLKQNKSGKLNTWFIKWHVSVMMQNGFTLYPGSSLVNNIGFDNSGVHNGISDKFEQPSLKDQVEVLTIPIEENDAGKKVIQDFYVNLLTPETDERKGKSLLSYGLKILPFKNLISKIFNRLLLRSLPEIDRIKRQSLISWDLQQSRQSDLSLGYYSNIFPPYQIVNTIIGSYSYVAKNSNISFTRIGKFCSIGPNFICGWGIHPTNGLSTSPMFYSTLKQNGTTLSAKDKVEERKAIYIGNDVFIGMNVTVLDGVTIGDGAVIGAGAVVSKDIPAYAIAVGNPIKIIKYRFSEEQIAQFLKIRWWDFTADKLKDVELNFFDVDTFLKKYGNA